MRDARVKHKDFEHHCGLRVHFVKFWWNIMSMVCEDFMPNTWCLLLLGKSSTVVYRFVVFVGF
jgi:hypothetical protein